MLRLPRTKKGLTAYIVTIFVATFATFFLSQSTPLKRVNAPSTEIASEVSQGTSVLGDSDKTTYLVKRIIDGDTIELSNNEVIRLVGINAPEFTSAKDHECFGQESKDYLSERIRGKEITIEKDFSERDQFGRKLRYIYLEDTLINVELAEEGMAKARAYPPDTKYLKQLNEAQNSARDAQKGLWGKCSQTTNTE